MSASSLTPSQLTEFFHAYSSKDIIKSSRSTEAFANEVYDVTDSQGGRYFLKILKAQVPEVISVEAQMQLRLQAASLKTPKYLEIRPKEYVGHQNGKRFLLSKYISGESPKNVTPALMTSFGVTLAKVHDALNGIQIPSNSMQWLNRERVLHDLNGYNGPAKTDLEILIRQGGAIFERDLPQAVIHGDLWMSNVFAQNSKITTVFDLETAENTVRIIDLARTFTSMRFNSKYTSDEIIECLVKGYNSVAARMLTKKELASFRLAVAYVAGACATWHAIHGTRYQDPYIKFGQEALFL